MDQQTPKRKIVLVRHAQSQYNAVIAKFNDEFEGKLTEEEYARQYPVHKYNEEYIDCPISQKGEEQTVDSGEELKAYNVTLVLTSPLRRCLQTTQRLFKDHQNKPKVIVAPILKEVMSSSCDLGRDINENKKEFPDFDFTLVDEMQPDKELWYMHILENEKIKKELLDELYSKYPTKEEAVKNAPNFFAKKMLEKSPEGEWETPVDMNTRVTNAKKWIKEQVNSLPEGEVLAVVTHSRFLRSFISKEYGALGEFIGSRRFVNCEVFETEI